MHHHNPQLRLLKRRWKFIITSGVFLAIVTTALTFIFPLQHRADAQVFIISQSRQGVDPYTTIKSAERIGENLAQIISTDDFFQKVITREGSDINKNYFFDKTDRQRRKLWKKTLNGSVVFGTGVFNLSVYHQDPNQANKIVGAAAGALVSEGWQYVGGDVIIKLVNQPSVTKYPVRPNLILNILLGFIIGVLLSGLMVVKKK